MNAQAHRIIFNKSRGCLMAVGETARSGGGGCSGARRSRRCFSSTSSTSRSWYGKKKTTVTQHETVDKTAEVTQINAGQVQVLGNNVVSYGANLKGRDLVQVEGADKTALYAVNEEHLSKADSKSTSSWLGITYSKSTSSDSSFKSEALGTELTSEQAVRLGVGSVTDVRGAIMTAPKIDIVRSQGADTSKSGELILGTSTNTTQTSHTETTTTAGVWQAQSGHGSTTETANNTVINGKLNIANGINTTVQIPEGNLKDQIAALGQQPGLEYLKDLANDPKIKWDQVKLAHDSWSYSQQGLTGAGAALLAIAVAIYTGGMGAELLGGTAGTAATATTAATQATLMGSTALGAAANAGFAALASSAAVSFVNNGGDIGKTLKELGSKDSVKNIALAMVSAGALNALGSSFTIGDKTLGQITVADGFTANLGKAVVNNLATATMTSALTGTSLEDNLKTGLVSAFISAGAGQSANAIGDVTKDSQALKALAHALAGCMAGGASGGKQGCESGAVGAVVGELAAQWYDSPSGSKKPEDVLNFVKVVSAAAGALTGDGSAASVSTAVMTGVNAAMNNRLMHFDEKERIRIAAGGDADKQERLTKAACFEIKCWAQFPEGSDLYKTNYVSVAEMSGLQAEWDWVKGQKNFGAFNYTPSQKFTDWVASNTGLASGTLNGKVLGAATNKACASGDTSCLTGIGQQQNPALTEAEKKARAEYFGNLGEEYQRSANLAASMRLPQVALSYEIAAALTGLLEQVYEPSIGKVITESLVLDRSIQAISDKMGIPRLFVEEISNAYIKPRLQVISDAMDKAGGYKK